MTELWFALLMYAVWVLVTLSIGVREGLAMLALVAWLIYRPRELARRRRLRERTAADDETDDDTTVTTLTVTTSVADTSKDDPNGQ